MTTSQSPASPPYNQDISSRCVHRGKGWNLVTGLKRMQSSWKSTDDPAKGEYSIFNEDLYLFQ